VVGAWPYGGPSREHASRERRATATASLVAGPAGSASLVAGPAGSASQSSGPGNAGRDRPKGRVARYGRHDHYQDLRNALSQMATVLTAAGWRARVVADDNALVDRAAAERAGLGWFGKNSNILLPGLGSWFLLGSVITDAPLAPRSPVGDGCGSCRRCLSSCPTGALVSPGVLDARKCLAWLLQATGVFPFEYRVPLEGRIYGCDDCQEVCPANRLVARKATTVPEEHADVDLLELLSASDEFLLARYGRWYIPQRDPRYLRRNALIALANVADGWQTEVEAALARYLDHPDEMLRAHAVWAAFRAGRHDLVAGRVCLVEDPSPIVRNELARQAEVPTRPNGETGEPR
jgi:epoxyqueuosine reductase